MTTATRTQPIDQHSAEAAASAHAHHATVGAASSATADRAAEYRTLMRKWWFAAAVGVPTMILSYPWLIPGLRDVFTRGSAALWWLWVAMGVASLAVLVYSGRPILHGRVGGPEAPIGEHAHPDRDRDGHGLDLLLGRPAVPAGLPVGRDDRRLLRRHRRRHCPGGSRHGHGGEGPRPNE